MTSIYAVPEVASEDYPPRQRWVWREMVGYCFFYEWRALGHLRLPPMAWRTWCALLGHCGWRNECRTTQAQLAHDVGLTPAQVCRGIRLLLQAQVILPLRDPDGRPCGWLLSPTLVWRGRPWHRRRAREDYQALAQLQDPSRGLPLPRSEEASTPPDGTKAWRTEPFPDYGPITEVTPV